MTDSNVTNPGLEEKTRFLLSPSSYPESTEAVRLIETHMARVFLTDHYVYKMKKPVRSSYLDFSSLEKRYVICREELRLNRRMTDGTYLDVVPLRVDELGQLNLGERGLPVEWLVKMRRLREDASLPYRINSTTPQQLAPLLQRLCDFYRAAEPVPIQPEQYLARLRHRCRELRNQLKATEISLDAREIDQLANALLDFILREAELLGERAAKGKIVEGHGDLRPEHCFLTQPPQIIDCLEFDPNLRCVDPVDELSYLALECELLGHASLGEACVEFYYRSSGDRPAPILSNFYRAERALLRAQLAAAHLLDSDVTEPEKWRKKTREYLNAAHRYCLTLE